MRAIDKSFEDALSWILKIIEFHGRSVFAFLGGIYHRGVVRAVFVSEHFGKNRGSYPLPRSAGRVEQHSNYLIEKRRENDG